MRQLWEKRQQLMNECKNLTAVIKSYKLGDCELAQSLDSAIIQTRKDKNRPGQMLWAN